MAILPVAMVAALCLLFSTTRLIGVVLVAIMASLFPWPFFGLLIIGGLIYLVYFR